jgi:iron complex transport system permease protein
VRVHAFAQQKGTDTLRVVYAWILGGLVTSGWSEVVMVSPYLFVAAVVILMHRRMLDVLSVGDDEAKTLGISPSQVRLTVVIAASLGTAAAVAVSGLIGFVGLVVPHAVRLVFGSRHRITLPASALFGAAFLVLADVASRTIVAPAELPIGVITAFFGAPFFGWLLVRKSDSK